MCEGFLKVELLPVWANRAKLLGIDDSARRPFPLHPLPGESLLFDDYRAWHNRESGSRAEWEADNLASIRSWEALPGEVLPEIVRGQGHRVVDGQGER
jgi:hypothetical protein